jgi:hypothetical protein
MLAAILIVLLPLPGSSQSRTLPSLEGNLLHDARAVHDTALLSAQQFAINGALSWIAARVVQGSQSGAATVRGAYIRVETGAIVVPENAEALVIKEGSWRKIAAAGQVPEQGDYSWTEPLREKRVLLPEDFYSPFVHGGTIVFTPVAAAAGIEQFGTVRLIFTDWSEYVAPAFTFMARRPPSAEKGRLGSSELSRLRHLLSQENKLVATLAFRELVASGAMSPKLAANQVLRARAKLGAVYTYIVLTSPNSKREPLVQEVTKIAKVAREPTTLRSIALGAFAAGLFRTDDSWAISSSKSLLRVVHQRFKELRVPIESDVYLRWIFEKMGV